MGRISFELPRWDKPIGGIVPHAGWDFSGHIAAKVIDALAKDTSPETVVIFGGHEGPWGSSRIMEHGQWDTPLGPLKVDEEMAGVILEKVDLKVDEPARAEPDNTIELQLPFLRYAFNDVMILPIVCVPTDEGLQVADACAQAAHSLGRRIMVLGSTDLTHYGSSYGFSPMGRGAQAERWVREVNDHKVIERMLQMDEKGVIEEALSNQNACCPGAAAAAIRCAKALGATQARKVAYATSADVMPADDFVGYVGILYCS